MEAQLEEQVVEEAGQRLGRESASLVGRRQRDPDRGLTDIGRMDAEGAVADERGRPLQRDRDLTPLAGQAGVQQGLKGHEGLRLGARDGLPALVAGDLDVVPVVEEKIDILRPETPEDEAGRFQRKHVRRHPHG